MSYTIDSSKGEQRSYPPLGKAAIDTSHSATCLFATASHIAMPEPDRLVVRSLYMVKTYSPETISLIGKILSISLYTAHKRVFFFGRYDVPGCMRYGTLSPSSTSLSLQPSKCQMAVSCHAGKMISAPISVCVIGSGWKSKPVTKLTVWHVGTTSS